MALLEHTTVAVTGATGFLGRYLVDGLEARGARVVGVVRSPEKAPELLARGTELRRADLADPEALERGFAGADAVVSNAALLSLTRFRVAEYMETNVRGTRNVIDAAARAGVRRVVQISSDVVYRSVRGAPDEDTPLRDPDRAPRPWTAYALSKVRAEREAHRLASEHDLGLTVLRPDGIYGAFDRTFTRVHKAVVAPRWISAYPAFMRLPLVYAGDVAEAVARVLAAPAASGRAYNLSGGDTTAWAFLRAWREAGGHVPRVVLPVPVPLRRRLDASRVRAETGWRPRPAVEALRETLAAEAAGPAARRIGSRSAT